MSLPAIDPAQYESQLAAKLSQFQADFAPFDLPEPAVFRSAPSHFRQRAEFRIWHEGERIDYAMFDPENPRRPILMENFPTAVSAICDMMPILRTAVQADPVLRHKLYQVNFLATRSGQMLITLIYHRKLEADWELAARALAEQLQVKLIGRSLKQKITLQDDWLIESLQVGERTLQYQQIEGAFTQPNAGVNQHMLGWACLQAQAIGEDLLELYCGNGNFTVALAPHFRQVLATELSKSSVKAAEHNLAANAVGNVTLVRMASEEISAALAGERAFNRLRDIDLAAYRFSTLFVDPPRAGLDEGTLALARHFPCILYISCNPQTLRDNVSALQDSHRIQSAAIFDQFPYTHHLECGLLLAKR